jgi:Family of unknown function (DUF6535)
MLQTLSDPNISRPFFPSTPVQPPPFSPPKYAVWANSLWFLSLTISLTCAMVATLLQQWSRRYLRITQPARYSPHDRARIRAFYADGVNKMRLAWAVGVLPTLIHLSLFLFLSGLLIYLFNVNHSVFLAVVWWVGVSIAVYLAITFMPTFRLYSPYYTPLTSISGLLWHAEKMAKQTVQNVTMSPRIDGHILKFIFETVVEDHELAQFFERIPGFCGSPMVRDSLRSLGSLGEGKLSSALTEFLERTWSSNFVSDSDKMQRFVVCVKVVDAGCLSDATLSILKDIFPWDRHRLLRSVELGQLLRRPSSTTQQEIGLCAQSIIAGIISNVQRGNDRWIALAADQLGKSERVIRGYLEHGDDSVLLANLIYITRQIFHSLEDNRDMADVSSYVLPTLSNFDIRNTLPGLQHDFLTLREELVPNSHVPAEILEVVHNLYNELIQNTDNTPITPPSDPNSDRHPSDPIYPNAAFYENTHTTTTPPLPVSLHRSYPTALRSSFRAPGHTNRTAELAHESSHDGAVDAMHPIAQVAELPYAASGLPESQNPLCWSFSGRSPRCRHPSRALRVDAPRDSGIVRSLYLPSGPESPPSASTTAPVSPIPNVSSVSARPRSSRYSSSLSPDVVANTLQPTNRSPLADIGPSQSP